MSWLFRGYHLILYFVQARIKTETPRLRVCELVLRTSLWPGQHTQVPLAVSREGSCTCFTQSHSLGHCKAVLSVFCRQELSLNSNFAKQYVENKSLTVHFTSTSLTSLHQEQGVIVKPSNKGKGKRKESKLENKEC